MPSPLKDALDREARFAEALSDATRGIVVVMDPLGRITYANPFLARLGGFESVEAVIGRDWFDTFVPSRDREQIRQLYQRTLEDESVRKNRNPVIDAQGREHDIEWSIRHLGSADGTPLGVLSVGLDVSETHTMRRRLEREQARLASIIESTQDAFIFIDHRARVLAFNAAAERIFGYTAAEVIGQKVDMLMPDPYRREHDGYIERYERTGEPRAIGRIRTVQGQRRSGEIFPIELSVTKVGIDDEARYAAFIRDISEKTKLRERLLEHERLVAIGTTSAKFAHEVGNPLNGMLMNLQLMKRRILKNAPVDRLHPLVERVEDEVRRLAGLLDEFRSMSRRQSFVFEAMAPGRLLKEFARVHRELYESMGVKLEVSFEDALPDVHVDREKITQVLLNLVKNGAEAMAEQGGGVLRLRARAEAHEVVLEVSDSGCGLPEEIDFFEPFVTTKSQGTGLGLPVVRQIVAGHHGELSYESRSGEGTTFFIRLPLDPPSASSVNLRRLPY